MADLVTTPRDKAFISLLDITQNTGRAMFTTPDVPAERLAALRAAFDETMSDPGFIDRMAKLAFDLRPQEGVVVQAGIEGVMKERNRLIPELKGLLNLN
jgi:tripartite-type tricarboxylate transporter receptor subunit TctC